MHLIQQPNRIIYAVGDKCLYRMVVSSVVWPATSMIAVTGAPFIARCEQNECLRI